jgi:hypothetical protein
MGIGVESTPQAFIQSCNLFSFYENFNKTKTKHKSLDLTTIRKAYNLVVQENGEALLSQVGEAIRKLDSSFDPRTYGYTNFTKLMKSIPEDFELIIRDDNTTFAIKDKKNGNK